MSTIREGELQFSFGPSWSVERFDPPGKTIPKHVSPVDFVLETANEIVLVEVKDPSASGVPSGNREEYVRRMQTNELTHSELVPKARTSYGFLHLMQRDTKSMRYVVVIGTDQLSIQPLLLLNLADRLRKRLAHEADQPWKRAYVRTCAVVSEADVGLVLEGCSALRQVS